MTLKLTCNAPVTLYWWRSELSWCMQIDWLKEPWTPDSADSDAAAADDDDEDDDAGSSNEIAVPTIIAAGKATMIADRRYRVYRPHNSALSVLIIRRVTKHDAGVYRCNLAGSSTRQKYLVLNVTGPCLQSIIGGGTGGGGTPPTFSLQGPCCFRPPNWSRK